MLYQKPKDVRYVDMAIYIDSFLQQETVPEEAQCTIYEYLYHLILMLARKGRFFNRSDYYDDFAATLATDVYFRLFSPKRFQLDEQGKPKLQPIKSSLNYLKSIINFRRINFEQGNYAQTLQYQDEDESYIETSGYSFSDQLSDSIKELNNVDFKCCIESIDKSIKHYLKKIPYEENSNQWRNIYISVLLTFINGMTLSKGDIQRLNSARTKQYADELYSKLLYEEQQRPSAILYHLDSSMSNLIVVLVREVKHFMSEELSSMTDYDMSARDLSYIALSDINSNSSQYDYYQDTLTGDFN